MYEVEALGVVGGDRIGVFSTKFGRVAMPICYDIYFPELYVRLAPMHHGPG